MARADFKAKQKEWLMRYIPAEILGTITALIGAWAIYNHTGSYVAATASGWFGEGIGFYGYFVTWNSLPTTNDTDSTLFLNGWR